ncbi:MAG: hypothetical protein HY926_07380 [Elusimicrobia bacterium]|nr:hypothetical protein [Elusimicrobiota bacterium]
MTRTFAVPILSIVLAGVPALAGEPAPAAAETAKPASPWPGQWLAEVFGAEGTDALRSRGIVILQGRPGAYRLQKVAWKPLESLVRSTKNVQQFFESFQRLKAGQGLAPAGPLPFLALGDLPPEGLMTAPLHALLEAMAAYHSAWTALLPPADESPAAAARPAPAGPDLFETSWGKAFAGRTRADVVSDPAASADDFFFSSLAGVRADRQAADRFAAHMKGRTQTDVAARLAEDARAGTLSPGLRADLTRYLEDQRRLHALARIRRQVAELEKKTSLAKDLRALETVAAVLRGRPGLLAELEGVVQAAPPAAAAPELASAGLHLAKPIRLGQNELGDSVVLSGAYWVDGLPEKQSVEIEETTYRETPAGLRDVETRTVKRGNGGPYTFARRLVLNDSTPFTFHSVVSAPTGNPVADAAAVPVAKDFELALLKLAAADAQALACAFPEAAAAYAKLEESLAEAAREKPQYRELLAAAVKRREAAGRDAAVLSRLETAAQASRDDAAPEACRYDLKRTEAALSLARALPPGCDRVLADLRRQRAFIARRLTDQQAFHAAVRQAAAHRRSCRFGPAAEELARGLAVLEADPEARCGASVEAAERASSELRSVRADELWAAAFAADLAAAQAETSAGPRLAKLSAIIARIGSMDDPSCFSAPLAQAEKLAKAAGEDLVMPDAMAGALGTDEGSSAVVSDVAAQRRKLMAQAEVLQTKQEAEQAPTSTAPQAPAKKAAAPEKAAASEAKAPPAEKKPAAAPSRKAAKPKPKKAKTPAKTEASR